MAHDHDARLVQLIEELGGDRVQDPGGAVWQRRRVHLMRNLLTPAATPILSAAPSAPDGVGIFPDGRAVIRRVGTGQSDHTKLAGHRPPVPLRRLTTTQRRHRQDDHQPKEVQRPATSDSPPHEPAGGCRPTTSPSPIAPEGPRFDVPTADTIGRS